MAPQIKAVFGGGSFSIYFNTDDQIQEVLSLLKKEGVMTIDTARLYPGSEVNIGNQPNRADFTIDTKLLGGFAQELGTLARDAVLKDSQDSLDRVQIPQFDILYIHAPDKTVPIAETVEAINEVHKKGIFRRFGLSNFTAEQVQEAYDIAKSKGYVLPSVYQGNYSPVARHLESNLFPTLRKLNMAFYAYSPLAGGFLTKTKEQLDEGAGRFNAQAIGGMYQNMYDKPAMREALLVWNDIAAKEGVSKAELAYRWVGYNSALKAELGDAVIFGASKMSQIEPTAQGLKKGPLSKEAQEGIQRVWEMVREFAPVDNFDAKRGE